MPADEGFSKADSRGSPASASFGKALGTEAVLVGCAARLGWASSVPSSVKIKNRELSLIDSPATKVDSACRLKSTLTTPRSLPSSRKTGAEQETPGTGGSKNMYGCDQTRRPASLARR